MLLVGLVVVVREGRRRKRRGEKTGGGRRRHVKKGEEGEAREKRNEHERDFIFDFSIKHHDKIIFRILDDSKKTRNYSRTRDHKGFLLL